MRLNKKILLLLVLAGLLIGFFAFDLEQYFNLEILKQKQALLNDYKSAFPITTALVFFSIFVIVTGLSLPGAGILIIASGAIFGLLWGIIISSFASAMGATIAFLFTRYLFRDLVQKRFGARLAIVNKGIEQDGPFYLFMLRLIPALPFFVLNVLMGLTPIPVHNFYVFTQIGMLASIIVLANAGTQIAKINGPGDIFTPELLASFILLGIFPLITKKIALALKSWRMKLKSPE